MSGQFTVDGIRGQLLDPDGGAIGNLRARVLLDAHDALKADRDHLLTLAENAANGLRLALNPRGFADVDAARVLLEQTRAQIAKYQGVGT